MTVSTEKKFQRIVRIAVSIIVGTFWYYSPFNKFRKTSFLKDDELIESLCAGKSICRFGDGELRIMEQIPSDFYQDNNTTLAEELKKVAINNNDKVVVCIPKPLKTLKGLSFATKLFWISNAFWNRKKWSSNFNPDNLYGDTQVTRPYMDYKNKKTASRRFDGLKRIWTNKKICIIEGENTHLGEGNDLFKDAFQIKKIIAPATNAFNEYDTILEKAKRIPDEYIILISLGPTATVLANDLAMLGKKAFDIGHIDVEYEWMISHSRKKKRIMGKYVNEAKNGVVLKKDKKCILVFGLAAGRGGIETFFHTYYKEFDKNKYNIDFITIDGDVAFSEEYKKDGSKIYSVPSYYDSPIEYSKSVRKIIRDNKYDIVHINMLSAANIIPVKIAKREKVPMIIVHSHNSNTPSGIIRKIMDKVNRLALKDDRLIKLACSEKAGCWLFGKTSTFKVVKNVIDVERFCYNASDRDVIRKSYKLTKKDVLLGNVGRLCEQKNQKFLIEILNKLDSKYKLMIVGNGEKEKELKELVSEYNLEKRIFFVGNVDAIEKYYSAFDVFLFPSLFEGLPVSVLEAQANGLDCILSHNITAECNMGKVTYMQLNVDKWVDMIKNYKAVGRKPIDTKDFDVKQNAHLLTDIYDSNDKMPVVSIIVPVFNNEKYISKCIESLVNQSYKNIEIIIVNDGSTDNSENEIKKYLNDKRLIYIKQVNKGANTARGVGVEKASGDFVMFVDSDDWIDNNSIELLIGCINDKIDIVRFNHYIEPTHKKYKLYKTVKGKTLTDQKKIKLMLSSDYNYRELAFGLYRSTLFKDHSIFAERMSYGEDYYINIKIMQEAKGIMFSSYTLYHYFKNNNSSTTNANNEKKAMDNLKDALTLNEKLYSIYNELEGISKKHRAQVLFNMLDIIVWSLYGFARHANKEAFISTLDSIYEKDYIREAQGFSYRVLRESRRKSLSYMLFHHRMIKYILKNDSQRLYRTAVLYKNRYNMVKGGLR